MAVRIAKTPTSADEQQPETPVQEDGERQQDDESDERREMLAEETEPEPGHGARALQHHLQHAARMGGGVEGERQFEHVLEVIGHHGQAPAMGEPVRMQRDEGAGADGEQAEGDPGDDERHQHAEGHGRRARHLAPGEHVDDAPEQDRLRESGNGERHIGQREHRADAQIGPELSENADVKPD